MTDRIVTVLGVCLGLACLAFPGMPWRALRRLGRRGWWPAKPTRLAKADRISLRRAL